MPRKKVLIFAQNYETGVKLAEHLKLPYDAWKFVFQLSDLIGVHPDTPTYVYFYAPMNLKQVEISKEIKHRIWNIIYM